MQQLVEIVAELHVERLIQPHLRARAFHHRLRRVVANRRQHRIGRHYPTNKKGQHRQAEQR